MVKENSRIAMRSSDSSNNNKLVSKSSLENETWAWLGFFFTKPSPNSAILRV